jgi:hypothetical protein
MPHGISAPYEGGFPAKIHQKMSKKQALIGVIAIVNRLFP